MEDRSYLDKKRAAEIEIRLYDLITSIKRAEHDGLTVKVDIALYQSSLQVYRGTTLAAINPDLDECILEQTIP